MSEIHQPIFELGTTERQVKCRSEMEAALHNIVAAAVKLGWHEIEVAMALADASEDYVIHLAKARTSRH